MVWAEPCTSIVNTRQGNRWHYLPAYSRNEQGISHGGWGATLEGVGTLNMPLHASLDADFHH